MGGKVNGALLPGRAENFIVVSSLFQQKSSCGFESSVVALRRPDARPLAIR